MNDSKKHQLGQNPGKVDDKTNKNDDSAQASMSRRNFLRTAAVVTGGTALTGGAAISAQAKDMSHAGHNMNQYGSMMFMDGHSMKPGQIIEPPGSLSPKEVNYKVFDIDVRIVLHEILPGIKVHMFAFNGQVPGPEFHLTEGDWVQVNFTNRTEEMHTIHWHGIVLPYTMDGVPMVTQDPVHPGDTFVYRFQAKPAGTRWYHCHWSTPLHAATSMHGAFIIHRKDEYLKKKYPYTRDYTLMLESWNIDFAREEMNGLLEGMKEVNLLMSKGMLDYKTHGFFKDYAEFKQAVESGEYIAPYLQSRSTGVEIKQNFFAINGKSYPATKRIGIKQGEWIRVRLINASGLTHHMHLHGHDFWWVAQLEVNLNMNPKSNWSIAMQNIFNQGKEQHQSNQQNGSHPGLGHSVKDENHKTMMENQGDHSGMKHGSKVNSGMDHSSHSMPTHGNASTKHGAISNNPVTQQSLGLLIKLPTSGKSREGGYDNKYVMEPTTIHDDLVSRCAKATRGLVMVDNKTWDLCGGKPKGWSKGIESGAKKMDHSKHMNH